jgi:ribonuclease HI
VQHKINTTSIGYLKLPDGSTTTSTRASLEALVDQHFPDNSTQGPPPPLSSAPLVPLSDFPWITDKLITQAIHSFKPDKAAGPDDFKPILLQNLPPPIISRLNTLYTACISLGFTPSLWKTSKTIFIPKNGKPNYQDPRSFRPISLTSFFFKTLEKLMLWEAEQTCLVTSPMHENQHAFRKNHSCDIALSRVVGHIEKSILNGHYTLGVFLDIQGAFDNITIDSLESGMKAHGFPSHMTNWYINYMKTRSCQSTLFDSTIVRFLTKGTPQGGVFSPVAWNLAFDSLLKLFDRSNVLIIGFADDGTILISGPDPTTLVFIAQEALAKISRWGLDNGLKFSPSKTTAVLFHRKYKSPETSLPTLTLDNSPIQYSHTVKYLGVLLDFKLSWTPHIVDKINKAKKSLLLHRNAMGKLWGPNPATVRWLYEGIIKPSLTYGCLIWGHALKTKSILSKLHRLQRLALLPMSPVRSQTPTAGMEVLANITPLTITINELSIRTYLRIKTHLPDWDDLGRGNHRGHLFQIKKWVLGFNLDLDNFDRIPPTFQPQHSLTTLLSDFGSSPPPPPNSLLFYTDGSKTPDGIGAGFAVYQMDSAQRSFNLIHSCSYKLPSYATVFQAEVEAINQGARFALQITKPTQDNLSLYGDLSLYELFFIGDNKASLYAISKLLATSQIVLNCTKNLSQLNKTHKITLHWIKAHSGQEGNERADYLAKQGTLLPVPHIPPPSNPNLLPTPIPLSHLKQICKQHSLKSWNLQWSKSQHYRQTKLFFPEVDAAKSNHLLRLNRDDFGRAIRWITGHCFLQRHNNLLNPNDTTSPQCRLCNMEQETSSHIICQCEALCLIRHFHFQEFFLPLSPLPYIKQLTSFLNDPRISTLELLPHD